jgi:hypothetical protein
MPQLFTNNARALLTGAITNSATSFTIEAAKADLFPVANVGTGSLPSASNWFKATLQDTAGNVEIVYVRTRTSGSGTCSNLLRGQEGTTARAFDGGAVCGLRVTAADLQSAAGLLSSANTWTGANTFSSTVTGSVSGNAGTVTNGVYLATAQTLTNKTLGNYTETVFAISDGTTVNLDPNNGPIQTWTLGANRTPGQANWAAGQSITLLIDDGTARTLTWTALAVQWKTDGGVAPTLNTTGFTVVVLWKVGTVIYGARVGNA